MMTGTRISIITAWLAVIAIFGLNPLLVRGQPINNMEALREQVQTDKKVFIASNMELTESEAKAFWPIYENYQKDLNRLAERTKRLIQEYAENYETLTDKMANRLLEESILIQRDLQKYREYYLGKLRGALPSKKVARYFQLENKIQAIVNYDLAEKIPLVR